MMMSNTLYEMSNQILEIKSQLEAAGAEPELINDTLDSLIMPIEQKAENIIKLTKEWEAIAEAKKAEAKRLSESAAADLKRAENLKAYLQYNLQAMHINKLQAGVFSLGFKKGSEVVEINEKELPKQYFVPQPPKPIGKPELKKLVKAGEEIPGVSLVRKPDSLVVK
jgi:hypothetical protein